jgi:hypothetical protein
MQLQARLVHAEPGSRVVEVSAHHQGQLLGSALGEAATAEAAEDRALSRLQQRLGSQPAISPDTMAQPSGKPGPKAAAAARPQPIAQTGAAPGSEAAAIAAEPPSSRPVPPDPLPVPVPTAEPITAEPMTAEPVAAEPVAAEPVTAEPVAEPPPDPDDWSSELAQLDLELRRIGWQREQEGPYLERAFGHPSRSRLTSYSDLLAYLQALQNLPPGSDPTTAAIPLRRRDLLSQCDQLLGQLGWSAAQGRQFLERHFQLSSRQQLSDSQLLQFNMLLEGELIGV